MLQFHAASATKLAQKRAFRALARLVLMRWHKGVEEK
jgi:hypothetical protein